MCGGAILNLFFLNFLVRIAVLGSFVQNLASIAEERPSMDFSQVFLNDLRSISWASAFSMHKPMLFQHILFFPFQEIKTILTCFTDQFGQFSWWEIPNLAFRVHLYAKEQFIFDNVANAGKDVLVQQGIAD